MSKERAARVFGTLAASVTVIMFVATLEIAYKNVMSGTAIWVQPFVMMVNCFLWLGYGHTKRDWFLMVTNVIGIILAGITSATGFIKFN